MARKNDVPSARMIDMVTRYGELCTHERAAIILGISPRTVRAMIQDGRLRRVGKRVDVRSICEYIENPVPPQPQNIMLRNVFYQASVPGNHGVEA